MYTKGHIRQLPGLLMSDGSDTAGFFPLQHGADHIDQDVHQGVVGMSGSAGHGYQTPSPAPLSSSRFRVA